MYDSSVPGQINTDGRTLVVIDQNKSRDAHVTQNATETNRRHRKNLQTKINQWPPTKTQLTFHIWRDGASQHSLPKNRAPRPSLICKQTIKKQQN